jgi:hypothetical protein
MIPRTLLLAATALLITSCQGGVMNGPAPAYRTFDSIPKAKLEKLLGSRIYFGHQSVGYNIIQGLQDLLASKGLPGFNVVETKTPVGTREPSFFHSPIGENGDPLGKIRAFESILSAGMGKSVDIAFMKLCYVDIEPDTDVAAVFSAYKESMTRLKALFPGTTFVHLTAPLTTREKGLKTALKGILGRQRYGYQDNVARERLNKLIRAEYGGKEPLFDIALYESSGPEGIQAFTLNGAAYHVLRDAYTDDGGHLNGVGRAHIAGQFLAILADAVGN